MTRQLQHLQTASDKEMFPLTSLTTTVCRNTSCRPPPKTEAFCKTSGKIYLLSDRIIIGKSQNSEKKITILTVFMRWHLNGLPASLCSRLTKSIMFSSQSDSPIKNPDSFQVMFEQKQPSAYISVTSRATVATAITSSCLSNKFKYVVFLAEWWSFLRVTRFCSLGSWFFLRCTPYTSGLQPRAVDRCRSLRHSGPGQGHHPGSPWFGVPGSTVRRKSCFFFK